MTSEVFGTGYAGEYDELYRDKDYGAEYDVLESIFDDLFAGSVNRVLDLGCGTGNHSIELAKRGFEVTGVDLSASMLSLAEKKAALLPTPSPPPTFIEGDIRDVDLGIRFDAVLMMFAVLGYQLNNSDVLSALRAARRHLDSGGVFVCDVWYGPAVTSLRPSDRVKVVRGDDTQTIRAASGVLDTNKQRCEVSYQLWRVEGDRVVSESSESHLMRYFFEQELELFFSSVGLRLASVRSFDDPQVPPDETTWNVLVSAIAD